MEYTKLIVKSLLESDFIEAKRTLKDALFSKLDDKLQELMDAGKIIFGLIFLCN